MKILIFLWDVMVMYYRHKLNRMTASSNNRHSQEILYISQKLDKHIDVLELLKS